MGGQKKKRKPSNSQMQGRVDEVEPHKEDMAACKLKTFVQVMYAFGFSGNTC